MTCTKLLQTYITLFLSFLLHKSFWALTWHRFILGVYLRVWEYILMPRSPCFPLRQFIWVFLSKHSGDLHTLSVFIHMWDSMSLWCYFSICLLTCSCVVTIVFGLGLGLVWYEVGPPLISLTIRAMGRGGHGH